MRIRAGGHQFAHVKEVDFADLAGSVNEDEVLEIASTNAVVKATDEVINNEATLQADADLEISVKPDEVLHYVCEVRYRGGSDTHDLRGGIQSSGTVTGWFTVDGLRSPASNAIDTVVHSAWDLGNGVPVAALAATDLWVRYSGVARGGDAGGRLWFHRCQNAAEAVDLTIKADSFLGARRLVVSG